MNSSKKQIENSSKKLRRTKGKKKSAGRESVHRRMELLIKNNNLSLRLFKNHMKLDKILEFY